MNTKSTVRSPLAARNAARTPSRKAAHLLVTPFASVSSTVVALPRPVMVPASGFAGFAHESHPREVDGGGGDVGDSDVERVPHRCRRGREHEPVTDEVWARIVGYRRRDRFAHPQAVGAGVDLRWTGKAMAASPRSIITSHGRRGHVGDLRAVAVRRRGDGGGVARRADPAGRSGGWGVPRSRLGWRTRRTLG